MKQLSKWLLCLLSWYTIIETHPQKMKNIHRKFLLDDYAEAKNSNSQDSLKVFFSNALSTANRLTQGMILVCQNIQDGKSNKSKLEAIADRLPPILEYYSIIKTHAKKTLIYSHAQQQFAALKEICEEQGVSIQFTW